MPFRLAALASLLLLSALGMSAAASPRAAATVNVTIQNFAFSPASVTVNVGDAIIWTNLDSASHSAVTITTGFITAVLAQNQSTTMTFDRPGTFDYVCGVHGPSMRGTVIVRGAAVPTPSPTPGASGHVVDDHFQEAFPDEVGGGTPVGMPFLYASGVLGLLVLVRLAWVVRHW
ncbi:MAG TPA: cupredoxin domain-containing protein [Methylomirabilota bacterium]|nr:cupredoxin domain-containing protein [Methylomirabilota bacterium]